MTKREYTQLKKTINHHMQLYYDQDLPEITDYEYDQLMQQLKAAEKEHPEWITASSPTQKIGGTAKREAGVKVTHHVPMLSIEDVFTKEDVADWVNRVHQVHPDCSFSVEVKIDGLSMSIRYGREETVQPTENTQQTLRLLQAETRGDGLVGEDVTANSLVIPDVQRSVEAPGDYLELRGEVYMSHDDFERFNAQQEAQGRKPAANPRNLAAGTLRQLDPSVTKSRGLRMFIFNVQDGAPEMMEDHCAALDRLEEQGIPVVWHRKCTSVEEVLQAIEDIGSMRGTLPYDLDGAVVKINHTPWRQEFQAGSKYSAGHIAYKYPPEERVVEMDEIEVAVGRTGKLTFTGIFHDPETGKPARLCGTSVSRATLHNQDYITSMQVGIGGLYRLFKSGEIIPKLNGCVRAPETVFQAPSHCPVCGHLLVREEDTADIRCTNPSCPAQVVRTIAYFTSRDAMNIMGLGETLIEELVKQKYLRNYADIYHLKEYRDELVEKGVIGKEKNTDKLLANIEASKTNEPEKFLTGLAIRNVGKTTARGIMQHYDDIMDLSAKTVEELMLLPDIGGTTAQDLYDFFHDPDNTALLEDMRNAGVNMTVQKKTEGSSKLSGMTIVVTGTLPTLGRREAEEMITANGGKASGSVSKKTTYVLAGEAAGSKLTKAQTLGIPVLTEEQFLAMLSRDE